MGSWELDILVWLGCFGDLWDIQVKVTVRKRRLGLGESRDSEGYMGPLPQRGGGPLQEQSCHLDQQGYHGFTQNVGRGLRRTPGPTHCHY